ncbi:MAG: glycoside hydrolase family 5 protein [Defluviitaleaceae bacterium]|nr:glycoside hydrolase family 5 protein [Defluviitaleaceae bacterium]
MTENQQGLYASQPHQKGKGSFSRLGAEIRGVKAEGGTVVGVLWDSIYEGLEVPKGITFQHFVDTWGAYPRVTVIPLDANQIRSYEVIESGIDILVFPYGSIIPMDAFYMYSGQYFNKYLENGVSVLTTGGIPFMKQANNANSGIVALDTPENRQHAYDSWVGKYGVKYYPCDVLPTVQKVDTAFLPSLEGMDFDPAEYGIGITNSAHTPVPVPPHGNVFPERYPTRQIIPLSWGCDCFGKKIATTGILTQDYETGSRRIHFSYEGERHPLAPGNPQFKKTMREIFILSANNIFIGELESNYACYKAGEIASISSEIYNFTGKRKIATLHLRIFAKGELIHDELRHHGAPPGKSSAKWDYEIGASGDEFHVMLDAISYEQIVSRAENGFVVWRDDEIQDTPTFGIQKEYFTMGKRGSFITGTNYYESTRGEIMWYRPDAWQIIRDIRQMAECGVNMIRPHYHHIKWFRDYLQYQHGKLFPFYDGVADVGYLPEERFLRIFDLFIYLCHKYGIVYNGDLFTLVPSEMGDPRGWFGTVEAVLDEEKRGPQKEFLRLLENRYKDLPLISWDLFNEPSAVSDEDVEKWAVDLREVFDDVNPERLLCVGGPFSLGAGLDYDCPHGRVAESFVNTNGRPVLLQELHIDRPEELKFEREQGEELRRVFVSAIRSGIAGVCPWSWTRQLRLWQDTYEHHHSFPMEKWDDRLGLNTHEDGTLKIAGRVFKDMAVLLGQVNLISYDPEAQLCTTDKGMLEGRLGDGHKGNAFYHYNDDQVYMAMDEGKIIHGGQTLLSAEADGYVYFLAEKDDTAVYFKGEAAGAIKFYRTGVATATLVDFCSNSNTSELCVLDFNETDNYTEVNLTPEMSRYWIKLNF